MSGDNKLWEGHRVVLPELREMAVHRCSDCRFFVAIQGARETRNGCLAVFDGFRQLWWRVPEVIPLNRVMALAGREGLRQALRRGDPEAPACGEFLPRPPSRKP